MHFVHESRLQVLLNRGDASSDADIQTIRRLSGQPQRGVDAIRYKVECCSAVHDDRFAGMVRQYKNGHAIRRSVAPPTLPLVVGPGAANRAEHVSTQNPRADILKASRSEIVVDARGAALSADHCLLERACRKYPFVQGHSTHSKR